MKKIIALLSFAFYMHGSASAQIIFSEDFESTTGTALPTGWTKMCTGPTEWESGINTYFTGGAWMINPHTRFVGLNENNAGSGTTNMTQRLMSPTIDFTGSTGPALKFEAAYIGSTQWWGEELLVRYSVNNGAWITLDEIAGNTVSNWELKQVDLSPLAGLSNVKLAFEYSDNGGWEFGAMIDDVEVFNNPGNNVNVLSVNIPEMATPNTPVKCRVRNMGSNTITSLNMNYVIDGGTPVSQIFTGLNITSFSETELTFTTMMPTLALGVDHTVVVNATLVNGITDPDMTDNTATKNCLAATDVTSIAVTKLDGTAKGGVVLAIANQFKIPVKYIGVGEKMEDLQIFNKEEFVDSLFSLENA